MKGIKIFAVIISLSVASAFVFAACGEKETSESSDVTVVIDTAATTQKTEETVAPYDVENNVEFEEAKLFEVKQDVKVYSDVTATEEVDEYTEGMCILGVSTDGHYIMQDNGYIIDASCLEEVE
ncbi:MAG: hypothetical protein IK068_06705 [Lachnospiraceae bacterium]|nr:hypothetical protein [Lachnospiraceae bacterium]